MKKHLTSWNLKFAPYMDLHNSWATMDIFTEVTCQQFLGIGVTILFYKTTLLVRVQGSGYAMFINKVRKTFAGKIPRNVAKTATPVCVLIPC